MEKVDMPHLQKHSWEMAKENDGKTQPNQKEGKTGATTDDKERESIKLNSERRDSQKDNRTWSGNKGRK